MNLYMIIKNNNYIQIEIYIKRIKNNYNNYINEQKVQ